MNRWIALLLAIAGGAIAAYAAVVLVGGALLGMLWLYVFGDDPWPAWAVTALDVLIPVGGLGLWATFGWLIWSRVNGARSTD